MASIVDRPRIQVPAGTTETLFWHVQKSGDHSLEVDLGARANVTVVCFMEGNGAMNITQRARLGDEAKLQWQNVTIGGGDIVCSLESCVAGDNAVSAVDWLFMVSGDEHQTISVRNIFDGRNGGGEVAMKGVARDRGFASCHGMIEIGASGTGTQTYLTQDVLMLDATAKIDVVPALEIRTNDVKASHSASVSRVSPENLFYFATRGIPKEEARKMYVEGFVGEMLQRLPKDMQNICTANFHPSTRPPRRTRSG